MPDCPLVGGWRRVRHPGGHDIRLRCDRVRFGKGRVSRRVCRVGISPGRAALRGIAGTVLALVVSAYHDQFVGA